MSLRKSESDALALAHGRPELVEAVQRSRQMLRRRAWVAGAAAAVPFPGLDWAMDAAMLTQLLPRINSEFGLTPQQIEQLDAKEKERVQKAIVAGDKAAAQSIYQESVAVIDRIADKKIIHKNKASRHKSRLSAQIKALAV